MLPKVTGLRIDTKGSGFDKQWLDKVGAENIEHLDTHGLLHGPMAVSVGADASLAEATTLPAEDGGAEEKKLAACSKDFTSACASGGINEKCCLNSFEDTQVDYSRTKPTIDLQAMADFIFQRPELPVKKVLLVGVGDSRVAAELMANRSAVVHGMTISTAEKRYAEKTHAEAMQEGKYQIFLGNKYNPEAWDSLHTDYDLILDNNLASFACCPKFYKDLTSNFISRLAPGGRLLTEQHGMDYAEPYGYTISPAELEELAKHRSGRVSSDAVEVAGCPQGGCKVWSVTKLPAS